MSLISKAKKDPRLTPLISDLSERIRLKYHRSLNDSWSSEIIGDKAVISYQKGKNPSAALCHELLHVETQLKGYRRIKTGFSRHEQDRLFSNFFLVCLDNELQHHKFYKRFLSLGFEPESFYCDSDLGTEAYLRDVLKQPVDKLIEILPDFFTLIAPGGSIASTAKEELLESFLSINSGRFRDIFKRIIGTVEQWASSEPFDNVVVYKEIMLALHPRPNYTWFGFNMEDRPPSQGFFVDEVFEIIEGH